MDFFAGFIIKHRKAVIGVFLAATLICVVLLGFVDVNYNLTDYLPESAQSTTALEIMNAEFSQAMPNASVMVRDVSVAEAMELKQQLQAIDGVVSVTWLDDVVDLKQPLAMQDAGTVEGFYKNGNALFSVAIGEGMESAACADIRALVGAKGALSGDAVNQDAMQSATGAEVQNAVLILVPAIIILLILSTTSWLEPVLFLAAIGVSVLINMGTNLLFGEISFITNSVSPILQLAVSLDYAIFLLHSFADYRKQTDNVEEAMRLAVKSSMTTVAASAMTTLFGFIALIFMDFKIGADLGICLAKGILLSFVSVMVFLPALTISVYRLIDRTQHRPLMPSFKGVNKVLSKLAIPALILVLVLAVPSFLGQSQTSFLYGYGTDDPAQAHGRDSIAIKEEFGQSTVMALLVPKGDVARESALSEALLKHERVTSVVSYAGMVGTEIPAGFLSQDVLNQFYSENYARIVVYTDTPDEGDLAFATVEEISGIAASYYGDSFYSAGQSANLYDMKNVVTADNARVNLIAVISIFLVLLVTFKSGTLPFILLLTIEAGIWINLSIPYFMDTSINFIGYLVLSTVQLGATVDYAILLTDTYLEKRRWMPAKQAIAAALGTAFKSILVSAAILSIAGFTLYLTSSNMIVCDIGLLLGRGTLLSMFMVVCFLPAMLVLLDRPIAKTTYRARFYFPDRQPPALQETPAETDQP